MNMAINNKTIFRLALLLFMAVATIQLTACGPDTAPGKSTIKVEALGLVINGPITNPTVTTTTTKTQTYRITLADEAGLPLNDLNVNILGSFTSGQSIQFGDPSAIVSAPNSISVTRKTGDFGFMDFAITAPYFDFNPIHVPFNQTATGSATGGTLADGTYSYTVTALDFAGETEATAPVGAVVTNSTPTTATGSVRVSWAAVPGATGYTVYGRIAGSEGALITILNPSGDPLTYIDTGSNTPTTAPCFGAACNTTGLSLNSVIGTAQATSGSAFNKFTINY